MASSGASRHLSVDYSPRHSWRGLFHGFTPQMQSNLRQLCALSAEKNSTGPGTTFGISILHSDGRRLRANQVAEEFGRGGVYAEQARYRFSRNGGGRQRIYVCRLDHFSDRESVTGSSDSDYSGPDFSPSSPSAVRAAISVSSGIALSMIRVSIEKRADPIRDTGSLDGQRNRDPAQAEQ